MKYIFIVNAAVGEGLHLPVILDIEDSFINAGKPEAFITEYILNKGEAFPIAKKYADAYGADCVIFACGNNDTVRETAAALAHTEAAMGIIPMDKKPDDLSLKLYGSKTTALAAADQLGLMSGSPHMKMRKIDLGKINGGYFIGSVTMGIDSTVFEKGGKMPSKLSALSGSYGLVAASLGKKRFVLDSVLHLRGDIKGKKRSFTVKKQLEFTLAAITNTGYSSGFCPSQFSVLNDGLLEMLVVLPCSFPELYALLPMYRMGAADAAKNTRTLTLRGAEFTAPDGGSFGICVDGEFITVNKAEISVEQKALKLCTSIFK